MNYKVIWSSESEKTFAENLEYLEKEWPVNVVNDFLDRVDIVLERIRLNPRLFPLFRIEENIYKCVVHGRIILLYKIVDESTIYLITFWNTYQNPKRLKL